MISNPDFIIKSIKCKSGKTNNVLSRYKGSESVVMIPDGVGKIDDFVFADDIEPNETITKIVIPDSVTEISAYAFAWCKALKEIIISRKSGQKIPKIANLQYYKSKANYGTKKKVISR